jgi:hypothetical protein
MSNSWNGAPAALDNEPVVTVVMLDIKGKGVLFAPFLGAMLVPNSKRYGDGRLRETLAARQDGASADGYGRDDHHAVPAALVLPEVPAEPAPEPTEKPAEAPSRPPGTPATGSDA